MHSFFIELVKSKKSLFFMVLLFLQYTLPAQLAPNDPPDKRAPDSTQVVSDPVICTGNSATINVTGASPVKGSQKNVTYTLIYTNGSAVPGVNPVPGTGDDIFFTVSPATTTTYNILAVQDSNTTLRSVLDDPAVVTVNAQPTVNSATADPATVCGSGKVDFKATASAGDIKWYDQASGGNVVGSGNFSKILSTTTTYYVETFIGCASARTAVTVTVTPIPDVPNILRPVSTVICDAGPISLTAKSSAGAVIHWEYGNGNTSTGATVNVANLTVTTTFTAYAIDNGCKSGSSSLEITVIPRPTITSSGANPATVCGSGEVEFKATASAGDVKWYDASSGGTLIATSNIYKKNISTTTTFYAEAVNNICVSTARTAVTANVTAGPSITAASATPSTLCNGGNVDFKATASAGDIKWYDKATGGTVVGTGNFSSNITVTTTYYVEAVNNTCASGRTPVTVTVNQVPAVTMASANPATLCGSGNVDFKATANAGNINWYNQASGGTVLHTGNFNENITATITYYAEAINNGCVSGRTPVKVTVTPGPSVTAATATPSALCGAGPVDFKATASAGNISWYNQASGGTPSHTGNFTETITATTTYYAEATDNGCTSGRIPVTVTLTVKPTLSVSFNPANICDAGTVDYTANTNGTTVNWYRESNNQLLSSGNPYTHNLSPTTNYKIYAVATINGCPSDKVTAQANLTITPKIDNYPTNTQICINTGTTLVATASDGDIKWYKNLSDPTPVFTGSAYSTGVLNSNTSYYIEAGKNGCISTPRITVPVTVIDLKISTTTPGARCGLGKVILSAASSSGAGVFKWYDAPSGGTEVGTGASFTTPDIQNTTDYYVAVTDGNCTSARVKVTATISGVPSILSVQDGKRCGAGDVTLTANASAGSIVYWYTASTGGTSISNGNTYVIPNLNQNITYYVEAVVGTCTSTARTAVKATIHPVPNAPATKDDDRCGPGIVNLTATGSNGDTLKWYTSTGVFKHKGPNYNPSINSNTTFYVDATNAQGCISVSRTPVTGTIKIIPAAPTTTSASRCDAGSVTLTANGAGLIKWYTNQNGTISVQDGNSYTTPSLNSTTTYYVRAEDNGCLSEPAAVTANIYTTPKITSTTPRSRCGAGIITLNATSDVGTIKWYDAATNGKLLDTDGIFVIPYLSATTDYWVEASNNGCVSPRVMVKATINNTPANPTVNGAARCDAGSVELTASSSDVLYWYDSPSSTVSLGTGSPFHTPTISTTTKYYVEARNGNCSSARVEVTATIHTTPSITSTTSSFVCNTGTVTLNAVASTGNVNWYSIPSGGLPVGDKPSYTTPPITDTTYYYVEAENKKCTSSPRVKVAANVYKSAKIMTQPLNTTGCNNSTVKYEVVASGTNLTYQWQAETALNIFNNINDDATYSGTKTATLSVKVSLLSKLKYKCIVGSACASATTNEAVLTISNDAAISSHPATVNSCTGNNATFKVAASGGSLNYQWQVDQGNGVFNDLTNSPPYTGVNTSILTVNNVTAALAGYKYRCFVSSSVCGTSVYSDGAVLKVSKIDIANAGNDQSICIDTALLKGSVPTVGSGTWTLISGTGTIMSKNTPNTSIKGLGVGRNEFVWTIQNGNCNSADTVAIITTSPVTAANAGLDQTICINSTILAGNPALKGTGQWTIVSGSGIIANKNNQSTTVSALGLGKNVFLWTISNSICSSQDAVIIEVIVPPTANAGNDQSICNISAQLTGNNPAPGKGKWTIISGGGVLSDSTKETIQVTKLTEGKNVFVWTITTGSCSSTDSVVIDVSIPPTKAFAGKDQSVCEDSTLLSANMPVVGTGKWVKVSGTGNIADPAKFNSKITGLGKGINTFSWTVSKANCTSSADTVKIDYTTVNATVNAGKDQNICRDSTTLTAFSVFPGSGKWQIISGKATIAQPASDTTNITGLSVGENKFIRLLNSNCGLAIDTVIITRNEPPTKAYAGDDQEVCNSEFTLSANNPGIGFGKWTVVSGNGDFNNSTSPAATVSNLVQGNTVLRWTITNGTCAASSDEVLIKRLSPSDPKCEALQLNVVAPTGFSPNGDGINDKLVIKGLEKYPGSTLRIYNHLGDLVYEKQDYQNDWDATGNVKGIIGQGKLPAGTYYMYVDLNNGNTTKASFIVIKY